MAFFNNSNICPGLPSGIKNLLVTQVLPFLMDMLFGVFLQTPFESLKKGFINVKVAGLSLAINFL